MLSSTEHYYGSSLASEGPLFCTYLQKKNYSCSENSNERLFFCIAVSVALSPSFVFVTREATKVACQRRAPA